MLQLTPRHSYTPIHQLRRHLLYRAYLRHLQRLPDPYAWSVLQPHFRSLLAIPPSPKGAQNSSSDGIQQADHAESSLQAQLRAKDAEAREAKRIRQLKRARKELYHLQDAVAFHPHALERLLDTVYGIRGRERWRLINRISSHYTNTSSATTPLLPLAPPLKPLAPPPPPPSTSPTNERLRPVPPVFYRTAAKRRAVVQRNGCKVPLVLPSLSRPGLGQPDAGGCVGTGLEGKGVVEGLRILAGLDSPIPTSAIADESTSSVRTVSHRDVEMSNDKGQLPTLHLLAPHIRLLFPSRSFPTQHMRRQSPPSRPHVTATDTSSLPTYNNHLRTTPPPPSSTRQTPRTWHPPTPLTPRLLRRAYRALWDRLVWVRPVPTAASTRWRPCTQSEQGDQRVRKGDGDAQVMQRSGRTRKNQEAGGAAQVHEAGSENGKGMRAGAEVRGERWERCTYEEAFPSSPLALGGFQRLEGGLKRGKSKGKGQASMLVGAVGKGTWGEGDEDDSQRLGAYLAGLSGVQGPHTGQ